MSEYNCKSNVKDVGNPTCESLNGVLRRFIICPLADENGSIVEYANAAALTKAAIQARFNNTNPLNRFYASIEVANVEYDYADPEAPEDDFGKAYFLRHGKKTTTAIGWNWQDSYIDNWSGFNYQEGYGIIEITAQGNLIALTDAETKLKIRPIPIQQFYINGMKDGDKIQKAKIKYQYDLEGVENYLIRPVDKNDLDWNPLSKNDVYAMDDVTITVTNPLASGATVTALIDGNPDRPVIGLVKADLTLVDDAGGAETITSLTDNGDGTYTAVWTIIADDYVLSGNGNAARYDIGSTTFTVTP